MQSEDDEREECPDGTACKVRTNILHHGKYKHIRISSLDEVAGECVDLNSCYL